jgi:CheY-like chemotaxis protein
MTSVLIVEDEASLRAVLAMLLEEAGYEVRQARNGHDALDALAGERPALIVTDVMMPRLDGREFVRQIRAMPEWADIPIVMMSAVEPPLEALEIQGFVPKPFDLDDFLEVVDGVLGQR